MAPGSAVANDGNKLDVVIRTSQTKLAHTPDQASVPQVPTAKRTRKYGAKVKTGCRTCKTRRIKCDEKKPECLRCTSTGRKCDGYAQDVMQKTQALALSHSSGSISTFPTASELGDSVLYLEFYHRCGSPTLSSKFDHEFWSRIVLQMAQSEPAVRHAVIALGYLIKTETGDVKHARSVADRRKPLLIHYNKAVRCLVERTPESPNSIEAGLVACLLFMCIEFIRCDYQAAFAHLESGLKIIAEWQQRSGYSLHTKALPQSPSAAKLKSLSGPVVIVEKLAPMFTRALTTALIYGAPFEPRLDKFCPDPRSFKYRAFSSVLEAQAAHHELRNASVIMVSILFRSLLAGAHLPADTLLNYTHLRNSLESWYQSLQNLENEGNLSAEDSVVASSLKVSYYTCYLALQGTTDVVRMTIDDHVADFQALNHHARIVIDSMKLESSPPAVPSPTPSSSSGAGSGDTSKYSPPPSRGVAAHFTFEMSIIFPLWFAACNCRCPKTRRESVALLERNPPRESLFDARQHAMIARRVIEIEEAEVDKKTGFPVPRARLVSAIIDGDMDENGRFWAGFRSVPWVLRGMNPNDPLRYPGDRDPKCSNNEWVEWYTM